MTDPQSARAEDIRARIMVGNAMCSIAESESRAGRKNGSLETLRAVRHAIKDVTALLAHPGHVSSSERQEIDHLMRQLGERVQQVEAAINGSE